MKLTRFSRLAAALAAGALVLTACGSDDNGSAGAAARLERRAARATAASPGP